MSWAEIIIKELVGILKHYNTLEEILENIPISGSHPNIGDFAEFRRIIIKYYKA